MTLNYISSSAANNSAILACRWNNFNRYVGKILVFFRRSRWIQPVSYFDFMAQLLYDVITLYRKN